MASGTVSLSDLFGTDTTVGLSKCRGERERDEKVLNSLLFLCECVAAGEPSKCPASNISTKLIKLCQNRFIRECLLFLFRQTMI